MDDLTLRDGFVGQRMIVLPTTVKLQSAKNKITSSFYVTDLGYYPKAYNHYRHRKKGAKQYIFILCTEGEGWLNYKSERFSIKPNQYFMLPKNTPHTYGSFGDNPWSIYWMHFDGRCVESLYERYAINSQVIEPVRCESQHLQMFDKIYEIFNKGQLEVQIEFANLLSKSFISTFVYHRINENINSSKQDNLVGSITKFLNENLDRSLKTEDLVEKFNLSSSYLYSVFKNGTGSSIHNFFTLKKIQKACEYMNYTDKSIKEICFILGFQDPFYFSRVFKKHMGISPTKYKKNG